MALYSLQKPFFSCQSARKTFPQFVLPDRAKWAWHKGMWCANSGFYKEFALPNAVRGNNRHKAVIADTLIIAFSREFGKGVKMNISLTTAQKLRFVDTYSNIEWGLCREFIINCCQTACILQFLRRASRGKKYVAAVWHCFARHTVSREGRCPSPCRSQNKPEV